MGFLPFHNEISLRTDIPCVTGMQNTVLSEGHLSAQQERMRFVRFQKTRIIRTGKPCEEVFRKHCRKKIPVEGFTPQRSGLLLQLFGKLLLSDIDTDPDDDHGRFRFLSVRRFAQDARHLSVLVIEIVDPFDVSTYAAGFLNRFLQGDRRRNRRPLFCLFRHLRHEGIVKPAFRRKKRIAMAASAAALLIGKKKKRRLFSLLKKPSCLGVGRVVSESQNC